MKCPNCNGSLYFHVPSQSLKCSHCDSVFDPKTYVQDNAAQMTTLDDSKVYVCQNCGAEIIGSGEEAITYCTYCGSETILKQELSDENLPQYIIPFQISKQQGKNAYLKALKGKWFIPPELRNDQFIDRFRGIYIPFWLYDIRFKKDPIDLEGTRSYTSRGYDYFETYDLKAQMQETGIYGIPYDASRNFDDTVADSIAPYKKKDLVPYSPAYVAGLYADRPTVVAELYEEEVVERATESAFKDLDIKFSPTHVTRPRGKDAAQELLGTKVEGAHVSFLPVWFLTWRNRDRVAYGVVNGQTGKAHVDLPVDGKQFLLYTAVGAGILFLLLSLFLTLTSRFALWLAAILLYVVAKAYYKEMVGIRDRDNHVYDKGYTIMSKEESKVSEERKEQLRKRKARQSKSVWRQMVSALKWVGWSVLVFFFLPLLFSDGAELFYDLIISDDAAIAITFLVLLLHLWLMAKTTLLSFTMLTKRPFFTAGMGFIANFTAFFVAAARPVYDVYYYIGSVLCATAGGWIIYRLITEYNRLATRPLPSFFQRKGGNDHA